jgi:ATP-dependent Clp protease protease subunit
MNKFWKWVRNKAPDGEDPDLAARTLFLNGTIASESWFDDDVTPALFKSDLDSGKGPITVWINSPGGDVWAAAQIYNMLSVLFREGHREDRRPCSISGIGHCDGRR